MNHNATLVKIEEASTAAYNVTVVLILVIGVILLCVNVWFWLCFIIKRRNFCCDGASHVRKETSCETELIGASNLSLHSHKHRREYREGSLSYRESDEAPRKLIYSEDSDDHSSCGDSYRTLNGGQAISFISSTDPVSRPESVLVPCIKQSSLKSSLSRVSGVATLPRNTNYLNPDSSHKSASCQADSQQMRESDLIRTSTDHRQAKQIPPNTTACMSRQHQESSRPKLSTFCHLASPNVSGTRASASGQQDQSCLLYTSDAADE